MTNASEYHNEHTTTTTTSHLPATNFLPLVVFCPIFWTLLSTRWKTRKCSKFSLTRGYLISLSLDERLSLLLGSEKVKADDIQTEELPVYFNRQSLLAACLEDQCFTLLGCLQVCLNVRIIPRLTANQQQWGRMTRFGKHRVVCWQGGPIVTNFLLLRQIDILYSNEAIEAVFMPT